MNLLKSMKKCRLFYNFEDRELNSIFSSVKGRIVKYSRGTVVVNQGADISEIGVVLSGTLLKFIIKADGVKEAQGALEVGEMFGEVDGFTQDKTLGYSCVAADETDILYITVSTIVQHSAENSPYHQKLLINVLDYLTGRIKEMGKDSEFLIIKSMRLKISKLIYDKYKEQGTTEVSLGINRNEMAEYLNVSRPSMSREMIRMRNEGIIEFRKDKISIRKPEALRRIVEKN